MADLSSGSQSSDVAPKDPTLPFNMHRGSINPHTGLGTFHLEMPSSEGMFNTKPKDYPPILLEIRDDDQTSSLMRMKKLQHENILAVHFFDKDGLGAVRAFVEPYTGYVSDLFTNVDVFVNKDTGLVPSDMFQEIVSASLIGLHFVIENDSYHGNFSWDTTVYHQEKDGTRTIKLCNFETRKDINLLKCQIGDCHALAHSLEKVSLRVQKEFADFKPETCCLIDDLARRLRAVNSRKSLSTMKQENEDCVFFWDDKRKRNFYAYEMPAVWWRRAFLESFQGSLSNLIMPWDRLWTAHVLMGAMEKYRVDNKIAAYNFYDIKDFLRYISGLYTHETELKVPNLSVDAAVHLKHPRLLLDLKRAAQADEGAAQADERAAQADAVDVDNQ